MTWPSIYPCMGLTDLAMYGLFQEAGGRAGQQGAKVVLFGGSSGVLGPDSCDEELYIQGNR